ncbi:MAG: 4-hydroxybenzoate 3-monooxygenase [Rhodobacteraceae bacterium]|nr:4-hydroxybenzoate 3-monooxygenase [Paracoccaceae bacterium]
MRTQIAIIGGGPSGLSLARKLSLAGIDCRILERRSRAHVLSRIRAGVLEQGTVDQLRNADAAHRLDRYGLLHDGCSLSDGKDMFRVDFKKLSGKSVTVYGQTEITRDLYDALDDSGVAIHHETESLEILNIDTEVPEIRWTEQGMRKSLRCDFVAGCDGYHGPSRAAIPTSQRTEFNKSYPFGWLGILSETPPVDEELIYVRSSRGFALASMRNPSLSRYYLQVPADEDPTEWSDDRFWNELRRRLPEQAADTIVTGPSIEKSVAPLRSFVCEPIQYGRLFLCGDAAHIVPPTGAKGLNLAASDVYYLSSALIDYYLENNWEGIRDYSQRALRRVWKSMRFSWWMTNMLHQFPDRDPFDLRIQDSEFNFVRDSENGRRAMAENYTGLPY